MSKKIFLYITLAISALSSCQEPVATKKKAALVIHNRKGEPTYRIEIPADWKIIEGPSGEERKDTTRPLITFEEPGGRFEITLHSFPFKDFGERIAPSDNLNRWKRQLTSLETSSENLISFSGFAGSELYAENSSEAIHAFALLLSSFAIQSLQEQGTNEKLADITIKARGDRDAIFEAKESIEGLARSFQLIEYLPCDDLFF